jgi:mannose/cellobiose epimerase-like protein (N-acyl-D-glucosamine 2-epimerase family)
MIDAEGEGRRLLEFARPSACTAGFRWLDETGRPDPTEPVHTWITTRMTYVFTLAHLQGVPGAGELAEGGVRALAEGPLHDGRHGGWYSSVDLDGRPRDRTKAAYAHAFVVLAAASATTAGLPGAAVLLDDALAVVQRHFLDSFGMVVDTLSPDLATPDPYRGANSSMHMVEAFLAAGDATGDDVWHKRALSIAERLIHEVARGSSYRLPEHFTSDWVPLPDYNADRPDDRFRPYGYTPGHLMEWSRLLLQMEGSLPDSPTWLAEDAVALFDRAVGTGWAVDGEPGFVYTVDWDGRPVVRLRMHWVEAEALAAAAALGRRTREPEYDAWCARFLEHLVRHHIDHEHGSWWHELDERNQPSATVWRGKPDVYHAYQALLLSRLPYVPSLATVLTAR